MSKTCILRAPILSEIVDHKIDETIVITSKYPKYLIVFHLQISNPYLLNISWNPPLKIRITFEFASRARVFLFHESTGCFNDIFKIIPTDCSCWQHNWVKCDPFIVIYSDFVLITLLFFLTSVFTSIVAVNQHLLLRLHKQEWQYIQKQIIQNNNISIGDILYKTATWLVWYIVVYSGQSKYANYYLLCFHGLDGLLARYDFTHIRHD